MTSGAPLLELAGVSHAYGAVTVLQGLDITVRAGEFVAIVGPSGCGKTTLLNLCSGWLAPTGGRVERRGRSRTVFQHDGLFPWLTVDENVRLGLQHVADEAERGAAPGSGSDSSTWRRSRPTTRISSREACGSAPNWCGRWPARPTCC